MGSQVDQPNDIRVAAERKDFVVGSWVEQPENVEALR